MSVNAADTLDWSPSGISCAEDDDGCGRFVPSSSCSDVSAASDIKGDWCILSSAHSAWFYGTDN